MDINEIYTTLSEAKKEINRRYKDLDLKKKLENFWGENRPDFLDNKRPKLILSKPLATPNLEFRYFLDVSKDIKSDIAIWEYCSGKLVGKNQEKRHLGKLFFHHGLGKHFGDKVENINIINFNTEEGKKLSEVMTVSGKNLKDFHNEILFKRFPKEKFDIKDISEWFDKTRNLDDYYVYYLSLFIRDNILFENFLCDEKEESKFTVDKFLPSFEKISKIFGLKPLIVPLLPFEHEKNNHWFSYDEKVKESMKEVIYLEDNSMIKKNNLVVKDTGKYGMGVYAVKNFKKGEKIHTLSGEIISFEESIRRIRKGSEAQTDSLQIDMEMDMDLDVFSRLFNHNCDPTAGIRKVSELFALRDIKKGEEITFDYSATIGPNIPKPLWTMKCGCKSKKCRKILGNVLSIPKEQLEYYKKNGALQDYIVKELEKITKNGKIVLPKYKKITL